MPGYTKLFSTIVTSTIWREDAETCKTWITLLALKEKDGITRTTIPGLAHIVGVTIERCEEILERLQQPDKYSRSQDFGGKRIQLVEGGYLILNHEKYRQLMSKEERREYIREKVRQYRKNQRNSAKNAENGVL